TDRRALAHHPRTIRDHNKGTTRAGSRPRQQCRPGPQGAEEKDAARGYLPRDEAPRPLREAIGKEGAREGGGDPPRAQARAQAHPARGRPADETAARPGRSWWRRGRACPASPELLILIRGAGLSAPPTGNDPAINATSAGFRACACCVL